MDVSLCVYEPHTQKLFFSAANNPLYVVRALGQALICNDNALEPTIANQEYALYEIKADKQPIGQYADRRPFTCNTLLLQSNDTMYTFSDGFADQFGGPKGKKFLYKTFKEHLLAMQSKTMAAQLDELNTTFTNWTQGYEQIDDVLVFGVKVD